VNTCVVFLSPLARHTLLFLSINLLEAKMAFRGFGPRGGRGGQGSQGERGRGGRGGRGRDASGVYHTWRIGRSCHMRSISLDSSLTSIRRSKWRRLARSRTRSRAWWQAIHSSCVDFASPDHWLLGPRGRPPVTPTAASSRPSRTG